MMASSTTMPSTSRKANREIMLSPTPVYGSKKNAPRKATAIPTETHTATAGLRNSTNTKNTNSRPPKPFLSSVSTRPLNGTAASRQKDRVAPSGKFGVCLATHSLMTREDCTTSGLVVTYAYNPCPGMPSKRLRVSTSSKPSSMVATSPRYICVPSLAVNNTMRSKSSR